MAEILKSTSIKEEVLQLIQRLPDDCSLEDIEYHLYVRSKVDKALATLDDGKGMTQEEAERRMAEWLQSFGKTPR
jgi:ABC-type uncharacterized transport system ATPase subunit